MTKKVTVKKASKKFMILLSSCGDSDQARSGEDYGAKSSYPTADAARKDASRVIQNYRDDEGGVPGAVYVVEVVSFGKTARVEWV